MMKNEPKSPLSDPSVIKDVIGPLIQSLIYNGDINPLGKTSKQIVEEARKIFTEQNSEWLWVPDYTRTLLSNARSSKKAHEVETSCLFYALWIEHTLNRFVSSLARRQGLGNDSIDQIIRDTSYKSKCSWILSILGAIPLAASHQATLVKLMEARNSFVHYKWKPTSQEVREQLGLFLEDVERTVQYLQRFEKNQILGVSKRELRKVI